MEISTTSTGREAMIHASGRIDAVEAPLLQSEIDGLLTDQPASLIINLEKIDYLDSSGLALLVKAWRHQTQLGRRFAIVRPTTESARRIFDLAGFNSVFEFIPSEEPA